MKAGFNKKITEKMADLGKEIEMATKKVATYKSRTKKDDIRLK